MYIASTRTARFTLSSTCSRPPLLRSLLCLIARQPFAVGNTSRCRNDGGQVASTCKSWPYIYRSESEVALSLLSRRVSRGCVYGPIVGHVQPSCGSLRTLSRDSSCLSSCLCEQIDGRAVTHVYEQTHLRLLRVVIVSISRTLSVFFYFFFFSAEHALPS